MLDPERAELRDMYRRLGRCICIANQHIHADKTRSKHTLFPRARHRAQTRVYRATETHKELATVKRLNVTRNEPVLLVSGVLADASGLPILDETHRDQSPSRSPRREEAGRTSTALDLLLEMFTRIAGDAHAMELQRKTQDRERIGNLRVKDRQNLRQHYTHDPELRSSTLDDFRRNLRENHPQAGDNFNLPSC